jgi:flagellar hook-associated protein 2
LSDLGLEIQKDGSINFNTSKLATATNADFDAVGNLAATFGAAAKTLTGGMLGSEGSITAATDGAKHRSRASINSAKHYPCEIQIEARYKRQFSALDTLISSMNTTSGYLTAAGQSTWH